MAPKYGKVFLHVLCMAVTQEGYFGCGGEGCITSDDGKTCGCVREREGEKDRER